MDYLHLVTSYGGLVVATLPSDPKIAGLICLNPVHIHVYWFYGSKKICEWWNCGFDMFESSRFSDAISFKRWRKTSMAQAEEVWKHGFYNRYDLYKVIIIFINRFIVIKLSVNTIIVYTNSVRHTCVQLLEILYCYAKAASGFESWTIFLKTILYTV